MVLVLSELSSGVSWFFYWLIRCVKFGLWVMCCFILVCWVVLSILSMYLLVRMFVLGGLVL